MNTDNSARYSSITGETFDNTSITSTFQIKAITDMFFAIVEEKKKAIEEYMDGYELSQNEMEALIMTAYQRGTGKSTLWKVVDAIKRGERGESLRQIWIQGDEDLIPRRNAEWYLFTYGEYVDKHTLKMYEFNSETPFSDAIGE